MSRRTLACSVSASVYDQFRALLPEGVDVNGQLTNLVEHFIAGAPVEVDIDALKAAWRSEWAADLANIPPPPANDGLPHDQPDTAPMAVYDPDRPLQEQIDELEPGGVIQMPDYPVRIPDPPAPLTERTDPISTSTVALAAAEQDAARAYVNSIPPPGAARSAVMTEHHATVVGDPATCLHPHESLVRDGRFVRCTLCDRIIR